MQAYDSFNADKVRCAIIGVGAMGKKYAAMLDGGNIEDLSLSAVCCRGDESAEWAAQNLSGNVALFRSEDELYKNSDLFDAVIIVTPHKLHPDMSIRALKAGKHVLCDKPAGVTAADAESVNAVADGAKKIYAMMCHQRTYEKYIKIKNLLIGGTIGKVERVLMESSNFMRTRAYHLSGGWRSSWTGEGGGALINQGYHLIDMWNYLFGLPRSVYAEIPFGKYNPFAVDDEATIVMRYPEDMTGTFIITTGEGAPCERLEICGTQGRALLEGDKLTLTLFGCDVREYLRTANVTSRQNLAQTVQEYTFTDGGRAYEIMLANFAAAILRGEKLIADGRDSAAALEITNAAYLSAWTGKRVCLPVDGDIYAAELKNRENAEGSIR